jgi:hypothetical protein
MGKPTSVWLAVSGLLLFGTMVTIFSKSGAQCGSPSRDTIRKPRAAKPVSTSTIG